MYESDSFAVTPNLVRVRRIVAMMKDGQITAGEAKTLLSDPSRSLDSFISRSAVPKATAFQPIMPAADVPFMLSFENYRSFRAPAVFGTKGKRSVLPVTPEEIEITDANGASTVSSISGLTFSHAGNIELQKVSFSSHLPTLSATGGLPSYVAPFVDKFGVINPRAFATKFYRAMQANQPILFAIVQVDADGTAVGTDHPLPPKPMTIVDFSATYKHGTGKDLYFSMSLQAWYPQTYNIKTLSRPNPGTGGTGGDGGATNPPSDNGTRPQYRKYTVVKGDYLIKIAQKLLGDGRRWREIYKLNRAKIGDNPNLIYPGQVFLIPRR